MSDCVALSSRFGVGGVVIAIAAIAIMALYRNLALNSSSDNGIPDSSYETSLDSLFENEWHLSQQWEAWPCSLHGDVITVLKAHWYFTARKENKASHTDSHCAKNNKPSEWEVILYSFTRIHTVFLSLCVKLFLAPSLFLRSSTLNSPL